MRIANESVSIRFNAEGGHLDEVVFDSQAGPLRPLHRAPWAGGLARVDRFGEPLPFGLANLAGDFFCAPFSTSDVIGGPPHGPTANTPWRSLTAAATAANVTEGRFLLDQSVMGAQVEKRLILRSGHPVIYQQHIFRGGQGALPVAHHAMLSLQKGPAALAFSAKAFGATPASPPEDDPALGRSLLLYPQRFASLDDVELADGERRDVSRYPFSDVHEDILLLAERAGHSIGWSAACAPEDGFVFFAVKDARQLPFTLLWMSNGGRYYPPFDGQHRHVLGIEEGCTAFHYGHRASLMPNALTHEGYLTAVELNSHGVVVIAYALGCVPCPVGWESIADVSFAAGQLILREARGAHCAVPFDTSFLASAGTHSGDAWQ